MAYQTINVPMNREMTTDEFVAICNEMFGGTHDKVGIASGLGFGSISSVKRFLRGKPISRSSSTKIAKAWNHFVDTGSAPAIEHRPIAKTKRQETGMEPFVHVAMARDRESGRLYPAEQVAAGLIGTGKGRMESDQEVIDRIQGRFGTMTNIVRRMLRQKVRSMIVRAAPGVGKTYTIERELSAWQEEDDSRYYKILSGGGVRPFALYKALYLARNGGVVVLDDNDSFLDEDESLNMLKNALDSSEKRVLTWSKKNSLVKDVDLHGDLEEDDDRIPSSFEFNGSMIFITNLDFQDIAESGSARSPHVAAMIDRSFYVNLTINSLRDKVLWCTHIFTNHMAPKMGISNEQVVDIVDFVHENQTKFFILSLRLFLNIGELVSDPEGDDWKTIIRDTKFKANA